MSRPNVLYVMTDQQRFDTISALGNEIIHTPNFDQLVERGISFTNAYSQTPVCVPARYGIRTGCEPPTTNYYTNNGPESEDESMEKRCGPYLPRMMRNLGYRTFGVGKFHTLPMFEDLGYETHEHSEEIYETAKNRSKDAYASFIAEEHPEYNFVEQPHGERTEMYYMPQTSPLPAEVTVESWAADRAVQQIRSGDERPFFGFVSFIGPHPPLAPPIPFNRMYDPDDMKDPIVGSTDVDHMDEQIPWMNYAVWAEDVSDERARSLRARYYGEITYVDQCLGRILDAVEARDDTNETLICFFSDHGDHLGDHDAWQKESFFEVSCHIPFLLSWPAELPRNERRSDLVCLTDLFGIATTAAGDQRLREGIDILGSVNGDAPSRDVLIGYYGEPGTRWFKAMVRRGDWKYIFLSNGGREQLFDLATDPNELEQRAGDRPDLVNRFRQRLVNEFRQRDVTAALDDDVLREFPYQERERWRVLQFSQARGVTGFPDDPADVLDDWELDSPSDDPVR